MGGCWFEIREEAFSILQGILVVRFPGFQREGEVAGAGVTWSTWLFLGLTSHSKEQG